MQSFSPPTVKLPHFVFDTVYAFPPNRDTLGGTAYFIVENSGNILVDCPAWEENNQAFLQAQGGVQWLVLTHRDGKGQQVRQMQQTLGCQVVVQEQEAYLLPGVDLTPFQKTLNLSATSEVIWTPGYSPGSACVYHQFPSGAAGGVLFTGRHLLPDRTGQPTPLRIAKTFHWRRQLEQVQLLLDRFSPETLHYICPGANTGFLRGERAIDQAYERLARLDLEVLMVAKPVL